MLKRFVSVAGLFDKLLVFPLPQFWLCTVRKSVNKRSTSTRFKFQWKYMYRPLKGISTLLALSQEAFFFLLLIFWWEMREENTSSCVIYRSWLLFCLVYTIATLLRENNWTFLWRAPNGAAQHFFWSSVRKMQKRLPVGLLTEVLPHKIMVDCILILEGLPHMSQLSMQAWKLQVWGR